MMMELSGDIPVTLIIKAPNQHMADQTVDCMLGWTIQKLKQHLEMVYPTKPKHNEQRLIYSGKLLQDHLTLKEVLRQYDSSLLSPHTVHLVCSSIMESTSSTSTSCPQQKNLQAVSLSSTRSISSVSISSENREDIKNRSHVQMSEPSNIPGSASDYAEYQRNAMIQGDMAMYTPEQYAWIMQQQVYSQYMMQYMMYYQNYYIPGMSFNQPMSPFPQQAIPNSYPPQPPAQEAAVVNNGQQEARRQNVRMNAQGGMEEEDDDEGEPRDMLHHMYFFMRVLTFMGILFFYSNLTRFMIVCAGSLAVYFLQKFRKYMQRVQQQPVQEQNNQQQEEQQNDVRNPEVQDVQQQPQPEISSDPQPIVVEENNRIMRMAVFACNTVQTFFTSLLPTPPELHDRN